MKFGLGVTIAAFTAGLLLAPLGVPGGVLTFIFMLSFLVLIVTYYRSAIRQGHSGLVILPVKRGPIGYDGLKLRLSSVEGTVVAMGIALILGILIGVAVAIGMHEAGST